MTSRHALTCAFVNLKPGTGKTTSTAFCSSAWHQQGKAVLSVDADPGASLLRWSDLAGGFPWAVVGYPKPTIRTTITSMLDHGTYDVVAVDCPQMEDHERIVRPVLELADLWVVPIAPSAIEIDRMVGVVDHMNAADRHRDQPGRRIVLLNRTTRPYRTKEAADAVTAQTLTGMGFTVLDQQIPQAERYRDQFDLVPEIIGTPFPDITRTLIELAA